MGTEWIELPDGRLRLREDGVFEMRHSPGSIQTEETIRLQMTHIGQTLGPGRLAPLMVVIGESSGQTREARRFIMEEPVMPRTLSRCALVQQSPVSRVLAAFFVKLKQAPIPLRVFGNEEQALQWLKEDLGG